jgi:hypothetical protein
MEYWAPRLPANPGLFSQNHNTEGPVVPREDLLTLMVNVLSSSGVSGYKVLSPDETPDQLKQYPVVWSREDAIGFVAAYRLGPGESALTYAPVLIGNSASGCKGNFASGSAPSDGNSARVFAACSEGADSVRVDFSLIENSGTLFVFGTGTGAAAGASQAPGEAGDLGESVLRNASLVLGR